MLHSLMEYFANKQLSAAEVGNSRAHVLVSCLKVGNALTYPVL